ncbi:MAG: hypothetical protein QME14_06945 [Methanobacteriaceae archaeon]|nr:hypothetical protein [Methanobacteriaceae archaeon]
MTIGFSLASIESSTAAYYKDKWRSSCRQEAMYTKLNGYTLVYSKSSLKMSCKAYQWYNGNYIGSGYYNIYMKKINYRTIKVYHVARSVYGKYYTKTNYVRYSYSLASYYKSRYKTFKNLQVSYFI